ncbi:hypothetical protein ACFP3Q_13795 [Nocardioides sp. GCM10027113]|uniref:hypothetical protein n=1 Tax=unclassified Nocardioides TaxID=2615069 RepID=UPI00361D5237
MTSRAEAPVRLPEPERVEALFTKLLGQPVEVGPARPVTPGPATPAAVSVHGHGGALADLLVAWDLPLAAYAAAAIAVAPVSDAEDCVAAGRLTPMLAENLHEVADIAGSTFEVAGRDRPRLQALYLPGEPLPPRVAALVLTLGRRADHGLTIAGYGTGRLSAVLLPAPTSTA